MVAEAAEAWSFRGLRRRRRLSRCPAGACTRPLRNVRDVTGSAPRVDAVGHRVVEVHGLAVVGGLGPRNLRSFRQIPSCRLRSRRTPPQTTENGETDAAIAGHSRFGARVAIESLQVSRARTAVLSRLLRPPMLAARSTTPDARPSSVGPQGCNIVRRSSRSGRRGGSCVECRGRYRSTSLAGLRSVH